MGVNPPRRESDALAGPGVVGLGKASRAEICFVGADGEMSHVYR